MALTEQQSQDKLAERSAIGDRCIVIAAEGIDSDSYYLDDLSDLTTHASDAVSDILTRLFLNAGYLHEFNGVTRVVENRQTIADAEAFLSVALRSWIGDSEDYIIAE